MPINIWKVFKSSTSWFQLYFPPAPTAVVYLEFVLTDGSLVNKEERGVCVCARTCACTHDMCIFVYAESRDGQGIIAMTQIL